MLASQPTLLGELWAKERLYLKGNFLRMTQVVLWLPHACTDMHVYPHTYITTHTHTSLSHGKESRFLPALEKSRIYIRVKVQVGLSQN